MDTNLNKLIVGALVLLVFVIFITLLATSFFGSRSQTSKANLTPVPTQFLNNSRVSSTSTGGTRPIGSGGGTILSDSELANLKTFSSSQVSQDADFRKKLPYASSDFDIKYSEGTGQYYVQLKTPNAQQGLNKFLEENNMLDIKTEFPDLFVVGRVSVDQQLLREEDQLIKARSENAAKQMEDEKSAPSGKTDQQKEFQKVTKVTIDLLNMKSGSQPAGKTGSGAISGGGELDKIFNEAGSKVGTPPKMLKAIMSIECGRLLSTSDAEILAWSAPGAGLPPGHGCRQNQGGYGAYGPMQFVPGTFARYGSAVNRIGGYTHAPNIQNIKDSVYAAAEHFLLNSGASGPTWTLEQIKRAYVCYAAGCRQYDTGRLGADTERLFATFLERYNSY